MATTSLTETPLQRPPKEAMNITEGQKQALMDNLQLEITERARKLRAQYALQAQSLRTRVELRINRIPTALRKANIGELFEKYLEVSEAKQTGASKGVEAVHSGKDEAFETSKGTNLSTKSKWRGTKRSSDEMESANKENTVDAARIIPSPRKRQATVASNIRQAPSVLSPKSSNVQALPKSPVHPVMCSPQRTFLSRPASPSKAISPIKTLSPAKAAANLAVIVNEKAKGGRTKAAIGRKPTNPSTMAKPVPARTRRGAGIPKETESVRKASNTSNGSTASTGTTIVRNTAKTGGPVARKRNETGAKAAKTKVSAAVAEGPPSGRRVLRKRA